MSSALNGPAAQHLPALVARPTCRAWLETLLILGIFSLVGAWPAPDVNEPYYLGKAIHFWNPSWAQGDFFLETADTHTVFYFTFGWLSLWLTPTALAWAGRWITWGLLAWSWQRLSFTVLPRRWMAVLTAALFITAQESCQMAGEWLVGGVEAKGLAYVLVFLGLEALLRDRWNRAWLLFGVATLFHVLVGGWSAVAAGVAWLALGKTRPPLRTFWPGLLGSLLLALPALIPSLMLTWGVPAEIVRRADDIYVFERLYHHLDPAQFRREFVIRFASLFAFWLILCRTAPRDEGERRLRRFVAASIGLVATGAAIDLLKLCDPALAGSLLRFYWFRLADVMLPAGAALGVGALIADDLAGFGDSAEKGGRHHLPERPGGCCAQMVPVTFFLPTRRILGRVWLAAAILVCAANLGWYAQCRMSPGVPRADKWVAYSDWVDVCRWIADSGTIPGRTTFLTPKLSTTFKWRTARAEVVNWKDIPQDARSIVAWRDRLADVFGPRSDSKYSRWRGPLAAQGAARLRRLGEKYGADYVLAEAEPRVDGLERLYANSSYSVYRLKSP